MNNRDSYLSVLPIADEKREIQENSFKALNSFLPTKDFELRDERINDYGVDASLEILENRKATNFRTQIQLKGTRSLEPNRDGSYSLADLKPKNLNYLLNNPISIYILYIETKNEFRFVWADAEFKRLADENPKWLEQTTITLRFTEILDLAKLNEIREIIIKKGVFARSLSETLLMSESSNVVLEINSETLEITDSEKLKDFILKKGLSFCIAGYSKQILEKINFLSLENRKLPKIQIIKAVAEFENRLFQRAKETLSILESTDPKLSEEDELMKIFVKLHCNYETGKIEHEEFVEKLKELSEGERKKILFDIRLSYLKNAINGEKNIETRRNLLNELKDKINKNIDNNSVNLVDLRNKSLLLDIEGHQIDLEFSKEIGDILLKSAIGFGGGFESVFISYNKKIAEWENQINEVAVLSNDEITFANVFCLKASVFIYRQTALFLLAKYSPFYVFDQTEIISKIKIDLSNAINIYSNNELLEQQLRAKTLLSEVLILENQISQAEKINSDVLALSDDLNYSSVKYRASNPLLINVRESLNKSRDSDERDSALDDETIELYSQQRIEALKIPQERLENIKKGLYFARDRATEKLNWCGHLDLLEDSSHLFDLTTYYSVNPNRRAFCNRYGYNPDFINSDWNLVITRFKKSFCENCPDRKPKEKFR